VHVYVGSILFWLCVGLIDFAVTFVVRTNASDCLKDHLRNVSSGTLSLTHSLTHSLGMILYMSLLHQLLFLL